MRKQTTWMQELQKWFPQETLRRFFERQDIRKISLAVVMAISGCTSKIPDLPAVSATEQKELAKQPVQKPETFEKKLPPDFKKEATKLYETINAFTDEDLSRAKVSREELSRALTQLNHIFFVYGEESESPRATIETRLFRDGIRYFVKWDDSKERPLGSDDALSTVDEAMQELGGRTGGLIDIQKVNSEKEANVVFTFRGFDVDENGKKDTAGGRTYIAYKTRKLPLVGEYLENFFDLIEFNLNKDLTDTKTQNIVLENKTGKEFKGIESLPRDVQRDIYKAYFKKAIIHEVIHRLLGFMDHNDEMSSSVMNSIVHILLTLSEEEDGDGGKRLKAHIATDMEDSADPVNPLLRVIWLVLDKIGALKKDFIPEEVARSAQYILGPIPIDKAGESL